MDSRRTRVLLKEIGNMSDHLSKSAAKNTQSLKTKQTNLPAGKEEHSREASISVSKIQQETFMGPIPHPDLLKGYEEILPGAADRILTMAENEEAHRHEIENKCVKTDSRDSLLGILCAAGISIAALVIGAMIIINVQSTGGAISGTILSISGIASIIATFLKNTRTTWKTQDKKDE